MLELLNFDLIGCIFFLFGAHHNISNLQMAGRRGRLASLDLLSKLKEGQGILKKSIENIQASPRTAATSQALLRQRKFDGHCRDSLTVDLNRASNFPKKRARLQQLSPAYEVSGIMCGIMCASSKPTQHLVFAINQLLLTHLNAVHHTIADTHEDACSQCSLYHVAITSLLHHMYAISCVYHV